MDTAVGLVQSYLYMNGYFTVTEYPVLELIADGEYRTVTDVDILALRMPGAGRSTGSPNGAVLAVDPALDVDPDRVDLIIAEVHLDDTSGPDLCEKIKGQPALEDVPVMFLSGAQIPDGYDIQIDGVFEIERAVSTEDASWGSVKALFN